MADDKIYKSRINTEEDYIKCPKFNNSLSKLLIKNPNGLKDDAISRVLMLTKERVKEIYQDAINILKREMGD